MIHNYTKTETRHSDNIISYNYGACEVIVIGVPDHQIEDCLEKVQIHIVNRLERNESPDRISRYVQWDTTIDNIIEI